MGNPSPENDNAHLESSENNNSHLEPLENNIVHLLNTNPPAENASKQDPEEQERVRFESKMEDLRKKLQDFDVSEEELKKLEAEAKEKKAKKKENQQAQLNAAVYGFAQGIQKPAGGQSSSSSPRPSQSYQGVAVGHCQIAAPPPDTPMVVIPPELHYTLTKLADKFKQQAVEGPSMAFDVDYLKNREKQIRDACTNWKPKLDVDSDKKTPAEKQKGKGFFNKVANIFTRKEGGKTADRESPPQETPESPSSAPQEIPPRECFDNLPSSDVEQARDTYISSCENSFLNNESETLLEDTVQDKQLGQTSMDEAINGTVPSRDSWDILSLVERRPSYVNALSESPVRREQAESLGSQALSSDDEIQSGRRSRQSKRSYIIDDFDSSDVITRTPTKRKPSDGKRISLREKSPPLTRAVKIAGNTEFREFIEINSQKLLNTDMGRNGGQIQVDSLQRFSHQAKDSNSGLCTFCHEVQSNLRQHLRSHIVAGLSKEEEEELITALKHNMTLSMMVLDRRHSRNFAHNKEQWSALMKDMTPRDQNALIQLAESAGIYFYPNSKTFDWERREQWKVVEEQETHESERVYEGMELGSENGNVHQMTPESDIGDLSYDRKGCYEEIPMGSANKDKRNLAKEKGLDRQLIPVQHPLLQNLYEYQVRMSTKNPRTEAKCRNAEEYARSIVNGGAKWLLVTLRLAKEYRTLRTLEDIPFKFFVSGLQAYSHAHMEVFPSGAVLNFLKCCMLFMKRLEVVDSFNANTEKWFTLFEVVKQRVAYQTKIANQIAVSHQAIGRAAREILSYAELCTQLKPMENWLAQFYQDWKTAPENVVQENIDALHWNAFGSFLVVMLVVENGERAEVAYKWRVKDFSNGGTVFPPNYQREKGSMTCFMFPFPTSKTSRSNVQIAASPTLRNWLCLYSRMRMILFPEDPADNGAKKFFRMFNGSLIRSPLALAKQAEHELLNTNFLEDQKLLYFRNSATNTCAGCFLRLNPNDLDPALFPAQGSMNHQLRTHVKIYATDTRAIVYRAWCHLQKCRNDENYSKTKEQLEQEMIKLADELNCFSTSNDNLMFSLSSCKSNVYKEDEEINRISQIRDKLETAMNVGDQWNLKVSSTNCTSLVTAVTEALEEFPLRGLQPKVELLFDEVINYQAEQFSAANKEDKIAKALRRTKIALEYLGYRYIILVTKDPVKATGAHVLNIDEVHVSGLDMDPEVAEARPMLFFLLEAGQIPNWRNIQVSGSRVSAMPTGEENPPLTPMCSLNRGAKVFYRKWETHLEAVEQTRSCLASSNELREKLHENQALLADAVQEAIDEELGSLVYEAEEDSQLANQSNSPLLPGILEDLEDYYEPDQEFEQFSMDFNPQESNDFYSEAMESQLSRLQMQSPIPVEDTGSRWPRNVNDETLGQTDLSEEPTISEQSSMERMEMEAPPAFSSFEMSIETTDLSSHLEATQAAELRREDRKSRSRKEVDDRIVPKEGILAAIEQRRQAMKLLFESPSNKAGEDIVLEPIPAIVKEAADELSNDEPVLLMQYATNYWPACALLDQTDRCKNQEKVGRGVKAAINIRKGNVVTDYSGSWEKKGRYTGTTEEELALQYVIETGGKQLALFGHSAAFVTGGGRHFFGPIINHSPVHANCVLKVFTPHLTNDAKDPLKIAMFYAKRDIQVGEEILWAYAKPSESSMPFLNICPCERCVGRCHCIECKGIHFHITEKALNRLKRKNIPEECMQREFDHKNMVQIFMRSSTGDKAIREITWADKSGKTQLKFLQTFLKCQGWKSEEERDQNKNQEARETVLESLARWIKKPQSHSRYNTYEDAVNRLNWKLPYSTTAATEFLAKIKEKTRGLDVENKVKSFGPFMRNAMVVGRTRTSDSLHATTRTEQAHNRDVEEKIQLMGLLILSENVIDSDIYGIVPRVSIDGGVLFDEKLKKRHNGNADREISCKTTYIGHIEFSE